MKVLLIGILILAIALIAFIFYARSTITDGPNMEFEMRPYEGDALEECIYRVSGGELGEYYCLDLLRKADGWALLTVTDRPSHDADENIYEYPSSDDLLDKIQSIAEDNGMYSWKDLPESDIQALDAPTVYYAFKIKGETYSFTDVQALPESGFDALREICEILEAEYADKQN